MVVSIETLLVTDDVARRDLKDVCKHSLYRYSAEVCIYRLLTAVSDRERESLLVAWNGV